MQIDVYGMDLSYIGSLQTWLSMEWVEGYNSKGSFVLEAVQTDKAMSLLTEDRYVVLQGESDCPMVITSRKVKDRRVTVWGLPAAWHILRNRISTNVIYNTNAENALRNLVSAAHPWPMLAMDTSHGIQDIYTGQISDGDLSEYAEAICTATDMGFRIRKSDNRLLFGCYKPPANPNAVFKQEYGNLGSVEQNSSENGYRNVAVVAGAGEGSARITIVVGATSSTGAARREMYIDARNVQPLENESAAQYRARLEAYGRQKLAEATHIRNVAFSAAPEKVNLGDICTVYLHGTNTPVQVRAITRTIKSQNNTVSRSISVGDPIKRR